VTSRFWNANLLLRLMRWGNDIANRKGFSRPYLCSTKARQGASGCRGLTVRMERLDRAVVDHLEWRRLDPQRLAKMMDQLLERREEWNERRRGHITELRKRSAEAKQKRIRVFDKLIDDLELGLRRSSPKARAGGSRSWRFFFRVLIRVSPV
jgi:hypothetical protein